MKARVRKAKAARARSKGLAALMSAALAIPGLGLPRAGSAETPPDQPIVRFRYANYRDYQEGRERRMRVHAPMLSLETPLGDRNYIETSFTYDSMSGASPYYLSTLTGASEVGIRDTRRAGDLKFTRVFERFSVGVGGRVSDEDDYLSRGFVTDARVWTPDKNTTFALGFASDNDDISSTLQSDFNDDRRTQSYFFGVTQIINPVSLVQSNIGYTHARGYQSDPYKTLDNRPRSRGMWAWLTRYNLFFRELESSLHADYRFFIDTWGIKSHMLEVAWYQPVGTAWMIRPHVRYYSQSGAEFFEGDFPPLNSERFYSADHRMGDFGSLGAGVKLIRDLGKGFSADISFESFLQKPSFKLGGSSVSEIEDFYAAFFSLGVAKKF